MSSKTDRMEGSVPSFAAPQLTHLKSLAKNFSGDNLALVPLQRMSSTIQDVKKNGETLMLSAQNTISKLGKNKDATDMWTFPKAPSPPKPTGVRRSASDSSFMRPKPVQAPSSPTLPGASGQQGQGFNWLNAFNDTLNQARVKPTFQLLSKDTLEKQAKQLVHSASNVSLERVASQLLSKPKEALETAQQTINNCQQNLATLQTTLQQSFVEGKTTLEQHIQSLGEPGSPSSSGNRLVDLLSAASTRKKQEEQLPGYLQSSEASTIETLPTTDDDEESSSSPETNKPSFWGPFQRQAHRRRKQHHRTGGSSLKEEGRQVTIVTTAALPWMTGTAVNPLLRAAYLAKDGGRQVTLMIPWLAKQDQTRVYPNNITFESPEEQEQYVRNWVRGRTGLDANFKVTFYPGRYAPEKCSILPVGDPTAYVPDNEADVAILEEPEHLNWYHHGRRWTDKFAHVVGVVHTNYLDYARREEGGPTKEQLLKHINSWVTRIHCHKVVKLSDAVQPLPKQTTEFVHGVADSFLKVGEAKAVPKDNSSSRFTRGAYFIGKAVWAKGYTELLNHLTQHSEKGHTVDVDCFGTGEDLEAVKVEASKRKLGLKFHGARDHLDESLHEYKVFINPSTSDVVATTTAEALAMGKWVVCADHPSNRFFSQFKNCLIYKTPEEFSQKMDYALKTDPHPMDIEERTKLTWEAATERFLDVTELTEKELRPPPVIKAVDDVCWAAHHTLAGLEPLRNAVGAGLNTRDNPVSVVDYQPVEGDNGGLFDDKKRAKAYAKAGK